MVLNLKSLLRMQQLLLDELFLKHKKTEAITIVTVEKWEVEVLNDNSSQTVYANQSLTATISSISPVLMALPGELLEWTNNDKEIVLPSNIKPEITKIEIDKMTISQAKEWYYIKDKNGNKWICNSNWKCKISWLNSDEVRLCTKIWNWKESCSETIKINKDISYEDDEKTEEEKDKEKLETKQESEATSSTASSASSAASSAASNTTSSACKIAWITWTKISDKICKATITIIIPTETDWIHSYINNKNIKLYSNDSNKLFLKDSNNTENKTFITTTNWENIIIQKNSNKYCIKDIESLYKN
jgi:hypothetical protein